MTNDITQILQQWSAGDELAAQRLFPLIYDELRKRAQSYMIRERENHTLQPTALVNEAFLKLIDQNRINWQNRAHFFGVASTLMRQILVDHARARSAEKRGEGTVSLSLNDVQVSIEERAADLVALDEALEKLAEFDERKAKIVEMRFFGGLTEEEIAENLDISARTVQRDWKTARLWLYRELKAG